MKRLRDNTPLKLATGLTILAGTFALSLFIGPMDIPIGQMTDDPAVRLRAARALLAMFAGAGLSVSGVVFQAMLRNPLAEPYILGVSSGAGLGAAASIILGLHALCVWLLPMSAFAGAMLTFLIVMTIAQTAGGQSPTTTMLLAGAAIGAMFGSILMLVVSEMPSHQLHNVIWWMLGNLQIYDWSMLQMVGVIIVATILAMILMSRTLNVMTLGDESASHLGINATAARIFFCTAATLMTGTVVATCGIIGFVGLIVPHTVRFISGANHRVLLPLSAAAGGTFLILADCIARTVISPREIPIGVVTALIGGPLFIAILRRRRRHV